VTANANFRSDEFVMLLANAAWYLYEVGDYDIGLRVVETAFLACENKRSLQYAVLSNVAGCAYFELNRQNECRRYWEVFSEIQDEKLPDDNLEVKAISFRRFFPDYLLTSLPALNIIPQHGKSRIRSGELR
jgi:hypothetical protein